MLTHLQIKNFTIIDQLELELYPGMTVLTGKTGAGKSMLLDTLELVLGARADNKVVRTAAERCEISATFDINNIPAAEAWLQQQDINSDECIIRRTISADGRSRSTINGTICPQQLTRELGAILVNIHGQHEHQTLLKSETQLKLLDNFAGHKDLCEAVKANYKSWSAINRALKQLQELAQNPNANSEFLEYQIKELAELNLQEHEIEDLHQEYKQLSNSEELLQNCHAAIDALAADNLLTAQKQLIPIQAIDNRLNSANELLNSAIIQAEEASTELKNYLDYVDLNPERLQIVENRLNTIHDLARKHYMQPEELLEHQQKLEQQLQQITNTAGELEAKQQQLVSLAANYQEAAAKLTTSREQAAKKLSKAVVEQMQLLNMPNAKFELQFAPLTDNKFSATGSEQLSFMVTTNPGQAPQPLTKVASGGELSRISLAIQVITAQEDTTPTLIFDEVDVGIGGKTASIVGSLLKTLGKSAQVLCVTHLPQVAAAGNNHIQVSKAATATTTTVQIETLTAADRITEIARMLGGMEITAQTLAHAKEMLQAV